MICLGKKYVLVYKVLNVSRQTKRKFSAMVDDWNWMVEYRVFRKTMPRRKRTWLYTYRYLFNAISTAVEWAVVDAMEKFEGYEDKRWEVWLCLIKKPKKVKYVSEFIDFHALYNFWYRNYWNEVGMDVEDMNFVGAEAVWLLLKLGSGDSWHLKFVVKLYKFFRALYWRFK